MKTMIFEEQILSKDKNYIQVYFCPKWRLLCLLSLKYFLQHAALKTGEYHSHVMHLDQLLYIELTISFLTGITHTVNFQYQRL